jgi:hypothetical protein
MLMISLGACTTFGPVNAPQQYIAQHRPGHVWVTRADGSTVVLNGPEVVGDTLVGVVRRTGEVRIPLAEAQTVRTRIAAPVRTGLLLLGSAAVAFGLGEVVVNIAGTSQAIDQGCGEPDECPDLTSVGR